MKKQPSRAPSPTPTAFSGISNYRTESYRPIRDTRGAPAVPTIDYRQVSKTHYGELGKYLAAYLAAAPPNSRSNARSKLTRLTIQQFHELSTDVYDELIRRNKENEVPFLPVREEFHPKRNQARQKLATLPTSRFEDLSSDVFFELARRYPEFKEDPSGGQGGSTTDTYDDYPAPDYPSSTTNGVQRSNTNSRASGRVSSDRERPPDSGYGGSISGRKPSIDSRRRPSEDLNGTRRSEDTYRRQQDDGYSTRSGGEDGFAAAMGSRRKPSQDIGPGRRSEDREREFRRPGAAPSVTSESTVSAGPAQSATATSAMIIPNKSTMEEEYIDIPYGREARESGMTSIDDRAGDSSREMAGDGEPPDSASDYAVPMNSRSPPAGLMGLSARLKDVEDDDERQALGNRSTDDLYDKYGRSSVDSARSAAGVNARMFGGRTSVNDVDTNKIRSDYEYKIATMQSQINSMQRDLSDAAENDRRRKESEERVRQLDEELVGFREQFEQQSMTMISIQKELEDVKETRQREARQMKEEREELSILRDRCHRLEQENEVRLQGGDSDIVDQLRNDMEGLIAEVSELSRRNDELMASKDSDNALIREMDSQLKEYKRKYELAKTELRSVKATSQLFLQAPKFDKNEDQLPVASDGAILDIHVTAFLSAIDSLLTAGRSNAPTRVLTPMKAVVNAVTNIIDNVKSFEQRAPRDRPPTVDIYNVRELRDRAEVTLSNLVTATKNHASGAGMSPVSLLDAAASHVSGTIAELGKMVFIRKATKAEQEQYQYSTYTGPSASGSFSPSLRSVEERAIGHQRKGSQASVSSRGAGRYGDPSSPPQSQGRSFIVDPRRRPPSENSSSEQTSSPPPIFDSNGNPGGVVSDDSAQAEAPEDAWAELKPYLEAQTDEIVKAIQKVLSGVRTPAPLPMLNDNLTQIITIVSSIVAVCNDNFPPAGAAQGMEILHELSEHANKLSEVQLLPEVTKDSRQVTAKSSFAIANAMKALMKL